MGLLCNINFPSCPSQNAKSLITDLLPSELEGAAIELEPYLCRKSARGMAMQQEGRKEGRNGGCIDGSRKDKQTAVGRRKGFH